MEAGERVERQPPRRRSSGRRRAFGRILSREGSSRWYVRFRVGEREVERAAGRTREIADHKLARAQVMLADGRSLDDVLHEVFGDKQAVSPRAPTAPALTLKDLKPKVLAARKGQLKASTLDSYDGTLEALLGEEWASLPVGEVKPAMIKAWRARRQTEVSPATVNRHLTALSALYTWAIDDGITIDNPVRRVKKLSERGRERETYLTEIEARDFVESASKEFQPLVVCALATGMRKGEIQSLTWRSVDLERKVLVVEPEKAKSSKARQIPLSPWLHQVLTGIADATPNRPAGRHVFVRLDGRLFNNWEIRKALAAAKAASKKIPDEKKPKVTMHTLRHTAASLMVAAGVPIFDVAKILGHSTLQVTMRYAHFAPEAGRAAIDALDRKLRPEAKQPDRVGEPAVRLAVLDIREEDLEPIPAALLAITIGPRDLRSPRDYGLRRSA